VARPWPRCRRRCASTGTDAAPPLLAARALLAAEIGAPAAPLDWEAAAGGADTERLGAWLYTLGRERGVPEGRLRPFRAAWVASRRQHLLAVRELGLLLDGLQDAGVPALPLKGPALAEALYRDPAGRPFTDLDLLVPVDHADRAIARLHDLGYHHLGHQRTLAYERAYAGAACFVPETSGPCSLPVDLHWSLVAFPGGLVPHGLAGSDVWRRAITVERLGRPVLQLSHEDLLLYLALHLAVHHPLTGLRWRLELAVLLGRHARQTCWETLGTRARAWGVAGAVHFALRAVESTFGVPAPTGTLRPRGLRGRLLDWLAPQTDGATHREYLVNLLSLDAVTDRLGMVRRGVMPSASWVRARYDCESAARGWRAHYGRALVTLARR
jgi:hypothetical protein